MRIAVWHNLPSGGGKRALYDHVKGLLALGHELTIFCPETADRGFLPLSHLAEEHVLPLQTRPLGAPARQLLRLANADARVFERIEAMKRHATALGAIVNRGGFDVVFANSCRWFFTPLIASELKIPSVLYLQEPARWLYEARPAQVWAAEADGSNKWWSPSALRHWLGSAVRVHPIRVQARQEQAGARAFDRVLVNSFYSRESVFRALGVDAVVCYLGIDTSLFEFSDEAREPFVLSVGELGAQKDPMFVVRSVARTRHKPRLVWVANRADEGLATAVRQLAGESGVDFSLHVGVSEQQLVRFYQRATALVYAPRLEPFGLTPLEANACGTLVIGVSEGGVRETVEHGVTGALVERDETCLASAIDELVAMPARARELGENASATVRAKWTLASAIKRLERHLVAAAEKRTK